MDNQFLFVTTALVMIWAADDMVGGWNVPTLPHVRRPRLKRRKRLPRTDNGD